MKFGKTIQSQQVPGWGEYYLNYKALKKIINSYAAGRPASDASLLSLGLRPAKRPFSPERSSISTVPIVPPTTTLSASSPPIHRSITSPPLQSLSPDPSIRDLDPLPPETEPPAPSRSSSNRGGGDSRSESFKAHRDVFFFTLQRELEKINAFYLIKERDLRLRLLTLLTNRKRLLSNSSLTNGSTELGSEEGLLLAHHTRKSLEWTSLEEGWRLFERDLGKLQVFIETNATGFRKILKKWDKRSKSNTKEMYLERQVEVQPCFNREFISNLSDIVASNLLDLENGANEHLSSGLFADLPQGNIDSKSDDSDFDGADAGQALVLDALVDLEANLVKALGQGGSRDALIDWLKVARSKQSKDPNRRLTRIIWRAALSVPEEDLDLVLNTISLDFDFIDNINGRDPLHQACIEGSLPLVRLCVERKPELAGRPDTYGRRPLHYAAMHGHEDIVSFLLQKADPTVTDMDGYTPLMYAITKGQLGVVRIFVQAKVGVEPTAVSNDLIPLSLACEFGQVEVARLLLQCGARVLPNSEGLYPQHFAAKAGHAEICKLLVEEGGSDGGGKDRADKYNLWTPLHHAAVGGNKHHLACIKVLVEAGCDVNAQDEYGKSPGWYAAWFGHVECLNYLLAHHANLSGKQETLDGMENLGLAADPQMDGLSPGSDLELDQAGEEFELIPSLSLPPPIIPLRVYGHEFLAQRCLVQLSLGHRDAKSRIQPIKLYSRSGQDSLHLWSSLKLVMTSKSDISAVPHSVILPLPDEREVFSFQVQNLDKFCLELSLYPTFGSKVIGRAVILPSTFLDIRYYKGFIAPLLDHHLKAIGEVAFEVSCIRPFEGAQLEIGGRVETYWKSKVKPSAPTQDHAHQYQAHRPLTVSTTSPGAHPAPVAPSAAPRESALVTASSLSGEYVHITVQVTRDGEPVVYPGWTLPIPGITIGVPDITLSQFQNLAKNNKRELPTSQQHLPPLGWNKLISNSMGTLAEVLAIIPSEIGINLQLQYSREFDSASEGISRSCEVNSFVDSILGVVYNAGKESPGRKIIFSAFDPTICTALNWKQPNYAVFFASHCGVSRHRPSGKGMIPAQSQEEVDLRCLSVREAVNFAKQTNLLGVILEATTLAAVPSLVASVKDAGLLLATFGNPDDIARLRQGASDGRTVDAFVIDGVMTLNI